MEETEVDTMFFELGRRMMMLRFLGCFGDVV
jgi:hypothetical protein